MSVTYSFAQQLRQGEAYEARLDTFFRAQGFQVATVSREDQRRGIDRILRRNDGYTVTVEYKADALAGRTGNAFVETVSVDAAGKAGWAHTSQAQLLIYLVVEPETIYCIWMHRLRAMLRRWEQRYRQVAAQNEGYRTHGLLVPLHELERIAVAVF